MANTVVPIHRGWDYQARLFWHESVRLFRPGSAVTRIGHEVDPSGPEGARAFDDVVVFYDDMPVMGEFGRPIVADHYQAKFRVENAGAFTWEALMDPEFIGASKHSLLQRLCDAQRKHAPSGAGRRFQVVSPWIVHPDDKLAAVWSNSGGFLNFEKLFKPAFQRVRQAWREHLGLGDDDGELRRILAPLRIRTDFADLEGVRQQLEFGFAAVGMAPFPPHGSSSQYDDLPRKLAGQRRTVFSRAELTEVLRAEGLWIGLPEATEPPAGRRVGIRSYMRWAEHMEDDTETMRCFVGHFDGRWIVDPAQWDDAILPELSSFLADAVRGARRVHVHLDTHPTIAFAAGWRLDAKSGVAAYPVQRGPRGTEVWCDHDGAPCRDSRVWNPADVEVLRDDAPDIAVVMGVRHDVSGEALPFIREHVPDIGRVVHLYPCGGPSSSAVRDAAHARRLAQEAVGVIRDALCTAPRSATVHVFAAAPNALLFFLGQEARVLGRCQLYEHDFRRERRLPYEATVVLRD